MRLRLIVAYDGAEFSGWQSQRGGGTVQDALEAAFAKIAGTRITVHGAGRTDAGVHALGQCAHVEIPETLLPIDRWRQALNAHLPPAVRVMAIRRAPTSFHARFSAVGKVYCYTIWNSEVMSPLENSRAWHVFHPLDISRVEAACQVFVGTHDFSAFSANRSKEEKSTIRQLTDIRVSRRGPLVSLTFRGEGFLYKMVRMMTGAAVRCGMGRVDVDEIRERLRNRGPRWNHVAPAGGLCLVRVVY
ncbi:MAG: tRNA pseudouridine(38-40) synthase TruA [Terrimicrobiaceae bacterium]